MSRSARTAKHVDDDEVDVAGEPWGECFHDRARIAVAAANRRTAGQRQVFANEVNELTFDFDDLLARSLPGCIDVSGDGQCTGTEVKGGDCFSAWERLIDDMPDPLNVVEVKFGGVFRVDMRLRSAVDGECPRAWPPRVGGDFRNQTAADHSALKRAGHVTIIVANS
ncbi:unannotated protein [freshwater metagenome]|uniref:Unannotated protein n=1 Tax=freshwater metagenome TaxID=449393 RepID=A0A6J6FQN4_9ZZZZ